MELIDKTVDALFDQFVNPAVYLFSGLCFIWFLYGVAMFLKAKYEADSAKVKKGQNHMLWGLIGLVIIFSAGAIYKFITGFFE